MAAQNRDTLKRYFGPGARPNAAQFEDLIDSALIMGDEGFSKTIQDGLRVVSPGGFNALVSFRRQTSESTTWSVGFLDGRDDSLAFRAGPAPLPGSSSSPIPTGSAAPAGPAVSPPAVLTLKTDPGSPGGRVGVGVEQPRSALDVAGAIRAEGRLGREWTDATGASVAADGKFHDISGHLSGCVAFEVMAGVQAATGKGRYALLHGVAMNAFNPSPWDDILGLKKRIRQQHAFYSRLSDRLQLRWAPVPAADPTDEYGANASYTLQIRTRTDYGGSAAIKVFVTKLWFPDS